MVVQEGPRPAQHSPAQPWAATCTRVCQRDRAALTHTPRRNVCQSKHPAACKQASWRCSLLLTLPNLEPQAGTQLHFVCSWFQPCLQPRHHPPPHYAAGRGSTHTLITISFPALPPRPAHLVPKHECRAALEGEAMHGQRPVHDLNPHDGAACREGGGGCARQAGRAGGQAGKPEGHSGRMVASGWWRSMKCHLEVPTTTSLVTLECREGSWHPSDWHAPFITRATGLRGRNGW